MKQKILSILVVLLLLLSQAACSGQAEISRVEPPFWWTGFKETGLQLLVYGEEIGRFDPSVNHPGVSLQRVERVQSQNYLFLYLDIGKEAQAGEFDISFSRADQTLSHSYRLKEKNPDPGHTGSFNTEDAIYLITPDRFANGDPENDNIEGMGDQADRNNPGGRHGGDIQGIADHLDYISDMGFTAIWLNPLLENRMPEYSYHGYSTTDFYRVDPRYGSNEQYRALVATAANKGLGVIMDMIVNHIGSGHWWMDDLPTDDWLNHQRAPVMTSHEHITEQDPYVSSWDYSRYSDGWFVKSMPDLNQRNTLLADYLTQNALWWIEYLGIAGIRMDTYPYPDKHYMTEWTRRVMLEYPHFNVVGEEWTSNQPAVAYWQKGKQNSDGYVSYLRSLMDFPLQEATRSALVSEEGGKMSDGSPAGLLRLYHVLANDFLYADPTALVVFPDNHDISRIYTQLGEDYGLFKMAVAFTLFVRGTPQIYYGTEILKTNPATTDHGIIRSDFPGGWEGDEINAFTGEGLSQKQLDAQTFVRQLLTWRKVKSVIHSGKLMHFRPENGIYVMFRYDDTDSAMLVLNKNPDDVSLDLKRFQERLNGFHSAQDVLTGEVLSLGDALLLPSRAPLILDLLKD
jgi:glycosidase